MGGVPPEDRALRGALRAPALALAALAAVGAVAHAPARAAAGRPASWDVLGVGRDQRSLEIVLIVSGCESQTPEVSLSQTATSVMLAVSVRRDQPPGTACPQLARFVTAEVALGAPLAGRAIRGRPRPRIDGYPGTLVDVGGHLESRVPRLLGMAPADARHTLGLYGLRERVAAGPRLRGRRRVVAQRPRGGAVARQRGSVLVVLSRAGSPGGPGAPRPRRRGRRSPR